MIYMSGGYFLHSMILDEGDANLVAVATPIEETGIEGLRTLRKRVFMGLTEPIHADLIFPGTLPK